MADLDTISLVHPRKYIEEIFQIFQKQELLGWRKNHMQIQCFAQIAKMQF